MYHTTAGAHGVAATLEILVMHGEPDGFARALGKPDGGNAKTVQKSCEWEGNHAHAPLEAWALSSDGAWYAGNRRITAW